MIPRTLCFINPTLGRLALVLLCGTAATQARDLDRAVQAAFTPRPDDKVASLTSVFEITPTFQILTHHFSVQPVVLLEKQEKQTTLGGKLAHPHDSGTGSDTIVYRIVKSGSSIKRISWQLNGGDWTSLSRSMMEALSHHRTGREFTSDQQRKSREAVNAALCEAVNPSWQSAAEFLIAHIAVGDC